jgi:hypothetical protein
MKRSVLVLALFASVAMVAMLYRCAEPPRQSCPVCNSLNTQEVDPGRAWGCKDCGYIWPTADQ